MADTDDMSPSERAKVEAWEAENPRPGPEVHDREQRWFWKGQRRGFIAGMKAMRPTQDRIDRALATANGRWCEWGMRAELVRDILEGTEDHE